MKKLLATLGGCLVFFGMTQLVFADVPPRDPVGETAHYVIDRDPDRTTSLILSGVADAEVTGFIADDDGEGPAYEVKISYDFNIQWMGRRQGESFVNIPDEYFTPEFLEQLRADGYYETEKFKMQHLGYADATTMDGGVYPNCDVLRIYDIQDSRASVEWTSILFGMDTTRGEMENMEIKAHVAEGIPVLGAVKLDMSGEYDGFPVKAGGDYERP